MKRRMFIAAGAAAAWWPITTRAQQSRVPQVGVLVAGTPDPEPFLSGFQDGLRAQGYVEGKNIRLDVRSAGGKPDRLDAIAAELVARNVDVIVGFQTPTVEAAVRATREIPIVAEGGDLVGTGLVATLAHPGGNVTGVSGATAETAAKNVQIIHDLLPAAKRIGVLANVADPFSKPFLERIQQAGTMLDLQIQTVHAHGPTELETAFSALVRERVDAMVIQPSLGAERPAELAFKYRVPAASPNAPFARAGGLISYSSNQSTLYRTVAVFVYKILKGAKPEDLPIELPTRFDLVLNLKTAKAFGLTVPSSLLARADEVIE